MLNLCLEYFSLDLISGCLIRGIGLATFFYCEFGKIRERRRVFIPNPDDWYKYKYAFDTKKKWETYTRAFKRFF